MILAGQAGIAGHHTIGEGARIAAQAGVFGDVPAGETWSGYPARPHREALRAQAAMFRLPSLIRALERLIGRSRRDGRGLMRRTIAPARRRVERHRSAPRRRRARSRSGRRASGAGIVFRAARSRGRAADSGARVAVPADGAAHAARARSRTRCTRWSTCSPRWRALEIDDLVDLARRAGAADPGRQRGAVLRGAARGGDRASSRAA